MVYSDETRMMNMKMKSAKRKARIEAHSAMKEQECVAATNLSANLNEAVELSFAKSSSDEARSSPRSN
jgi:hypothetical protein